ncbi:DUF983 domain-containing protein [Flavobacteriaceae bacterium]|nr:DUF983 domain-containing protein [Flavobacteriaceae bacterium]
MKGNKLYSIFTGKCPVCHSGDMYKYKTAYSISKSLKMHEYCPHCKTKFKIEPSFFYGAMYVSYAVGVAVAVAAFTIAYGMMSLGPKASFVAILITLLVLSPLITRVSRNIWINFFFSFDKGKV